MAYDLGYKPVYSMGTSSTQRPEPTTWQQKQEYDAQDLWNSQRDTLANDQQRSGDLRDSSQKDASAARTKVSDGKAENVGGYSAKNLASYQPTQLAQWLSALGGSMSASMPSASGSVAGTGSRVMAGGGGAAGDGTNLDHFDASALTDFDPSAYGKDYAQGAYSEFQDQLGNQLQSLENRSVGAGRLRTGMFDRDQGNVVTALGRDYNAKLAQAATTFSGQRLSALQGGTDLAYRRASDLDTNEIARTRDSSTASYNAQKLASDSSLAQYEALTQRYGLGLDAARAADQVGYSRASDLDKYGWDQATYLDDQQFARERTGLDAAMAEEGRYLDQYNHDRDNMSTYASANRDWAASDRAAQDTRDAAAEAKAFAAKGGAGGGTTPAGYVDPNQQVALAYGVPYRKY